MAYEFRIGEVSRKGLRRIARQQLRKLGELLGDAADAANGHHEARKCVKRLRAGLALARPSLGNGPWQKLDRQFSKVARALSGARDTAVLLQLIGRIESEQGSAALGRAGQQLCAELARLPKSTAKFTGLKTMKARLDRLAGKLDSLPLKRFDAAAALRGLEEDYRGGREALERAYATSKPEDFHTLRKHVQRHWRHMNLLAAAWPGEFGARMELAQALSEILGEERDYWLLRERLGKAGGPLARWCGTEQKRLRTSAYGFLHLLFAERPKALRERLAAYWAAAEAGAAQPGAGGAPVPPAKARPSNRQTTS